MRLSFILVLFGWVQGVVSLRQQQTLRGDVASLNLAVGTGLASRIHANVAAGQRSASILATGDSTNPPSPPPAASGIVDDPASFVAALRASAAAASCDEVQYHVTNEHLFGTLTSKPKSGVAYLDSRGVNFTKEPAHGVAVAWLVGPEDLQDLLNTECCVSTIKTVPQCFCQVAYVVGLKGAAPGKPDHRDYLDYSERLSYIVIDHGTVTNKPARPGKADLTIPSFENMVNLMPGTFADVFTSVPADERPNCTPDTATLVQAFQNATTGSGPTTNSWTQLANDTANADMLARLGATTDPASGVDGVTLEKLAGVGNALCTDALAARTYLWWALDVNSVNTGTGTTSDGANEYVTCLNPPVESLESAAELALPELLPNKFCDAPTATSPPSFEVP